MSHLSELGRSTMIVEHSSWHGKLYNYWHSRAHFKTEGYRENLCHYCRVVAFWAPLTWFFTASKGHKLIRPWVVVLIAAPTILTILGMHLPYVVWIWVVMILLQWVAQCYNDRLEKIIKKTFGSIWDAIASVLARPVTWFFKARVVHFVRPWMVAAVAAAAYLSVVAPVLMLNVAIVIGILGALAGICIGAGYIGQRRSRLAKARLDAILAERAAAREKLRLEMMADLEAALQGKTSLEQYERTRHIYLESCKPRLAGVATSPRKKRFVKVRHAYNDTFGLVWRFVVAKKHKICPFIEFEADNRSSLAA